MKQLKGYQFYRQKPIGDYIVDFFCPGAKLVIEIDGSHHLVGETIEYDRIRDDYLSSLGLRVLRFTNTDVLTDIDTVVDSIRGEILLSPPFSKGETGAVAAGSSTLAVSAVALSRKVETVTSPKAATSLSAKGET